MKTGVCTILVILLMFQGVFCQDNGSGSLRRNIVKLNAITTFLEQPMVSYERVWSHKWSMQLSIGYSYNEFKNEWVHSNASMTEFTFDTKVYTGTFRNGPEGFYVSGFFSVLVIDEKEVYAENPMLNYTLQGTAGFLGPVFGYQWELGDFMLDAYYGFGIEFMSPDASMYPSIALNNNYSFSGLFNRYGVSLGYRF